MASFLPLGLDVSNRPILIVGGGKVAAQKLKTICLYTKNIRVCAPTISAAVRSYGVPLEERPYGADVLQDAFLVYACTDDRAVNRRIGRHARQAGRLVNVADDPAECDFISPAVAKKGRMSLAVTSNGEAALESVAWRDRLAGLMNQEAFFQKPQE